MKSIYYLAGLAVLALASCSENSEFESNPITAQAAKGTPVSFATYQAQSTRAGKPGSITTQVLKQDGYGFGVFAYYTEANDYASNTKPNWMYNQKVYWSDGTANSTTDKPGWFYEPVKFWPNDNSTADNQKATGSSTTASSKISFFAYAPYTGDAETGEISGTDGIVGSSANTASGNPTIDYIIASSGEQVDLLWGTAGESSYPSVTGTASTPTKVATPTGEPEALAATNINITKVPVDTKIKFNFKHALAKIGGSNAIDPATGKPVTNVQSGLQVQLDIDQNGNITDGKKPETTKVTIKNIKIENNAGAEDYNGDGAKDDKDMIANKGTLDLATGLWTLDATNAAVINHVITSPASVDPEKSASAATLADAIAEPSGVTEWANLSTISGVLTTPLNVYKEETNPLVFIPGSTPSFKITVEYIVRTEDTHLEAGYSEATQKISHMVAFPTVELNKKYNLIMHLGLTSIKFDATVSDWDAEDATVWNDLDKDGVVDAGETTDNGVHLPINVK